MSARPQSATDEAPPRPRTPLGQLAWTWLPAAAMMAVIFAASSTPNLDAIPGGVSDKVAHFTAYAVLGALVLRALAQVEWGGVTPRTTLVAWGVTALYGASDEYHQRFVPGRFMAVDDWLADALGAGAAVLVLAVVAYGHRLDTRKV
jgi:VanZ family protein